MKKAGLFSIIVSICLCLGLIASCGKSERQTETSSQEEEAAVEQIDPVKNPVEYLMSLDEKVTVQWMTWSSEKNVIGRMNQIYEIYPELKDKFELVHVSGGANVKEMVQKLRLAVLGGSDVPDINETTSSIMPALAEGGMLMDLTSVLEPYQDSLLPAAVEVMSHDGKIYGFPGQVKTKLWFYRQDMFEKAGINPGDIETDEEFMEACRKFKEANDGAYLWFMGVPSESFFFEFMISGNGGSIYDREAGKYSLVDNERVREVFTFCKELMDQDLVSTLTMFTPDFENAIRENKLGSIMTGSWFKDQSYIPTYAPQQEGLWAVTTCPPIAGGLDRGSESGGSCFSIPKGAKNPEAAMAVLSLLSLDEEVSLGVFKNINTAIEPLTDYARENPEFKQNEYFGDTLQTAIDASMELFDIVDYTPASMVEYTIITQYFDLYLAGEGELDELLQKCEDDLNTQIGNPETFTE